MRIIRSLIYWFFVSTCIVAVSAEFTEVDKGKIPAEMLDKQLKLLPEGIAIWDEEEAIAALKEGSGILWVDTRPRSFFNSGTIKGAVLLVYNKNETPAKIEANETSLLNKESLLKAMKDNSAQKVVYYCQGPKCHRSYNAALRSVAKWGLAKENVVWFRAGFPNLLKKMKETLKLARRISKYLQGPETE